MDIPSQIRINAGITNGSVYYFKDEELNSDKSHYFIVINPHPKLDDVLLLACASSQVAKRQDYVKKVGLHPETLVLLAPGEYTNFHLETVIDRYPKS
jgi:hypothetical protein